MKTLILSKKDLTDENLRQVAKMLQNSKTIIFPTETVYGVGAHVFRDEAIEKIYDLKNRPKDKGLIVHLGKIQDVEKVAKDIPDEFYLLAQKFFPGPLTIVLKKNPKVSNFVSKDDTIAVRMPSCDVALKLINFVQDPIVGTSANISNEKAPISANETFDKFLDKVDVIIDAGICELKIPSTIVSLLEKPPKILRVGSILPQQIFDVLK